MLEAWREAVGDRARARRVQAFVHALRVQPGDRVLDLGGNIEIRASVDVPISVTLLNASVERGASERAWRLPRGLREWRAIEGNACDLHRWADGAFDIVFSNSVMQRRLAERIDDARRHEPWVLPDGRYALLHAAGAARLVSGGSRLHRARGAVAQVVVAVPVAPGLSRGPAAAWLLRAMRGGRYIVTLAAHRTEPEPPTMTITPTRLPGARAALARTAARCLHALWRIPAWQGVSVVMVCAAGAMVALSPSVLAA